MIDETIFVQIASYRDPELVPTILDMFENADSPELLHVCICWQHDDIENLDVLKKYSNIEIIDVPYYDSKGACWARNQIQRRYNGERFTLQLDSHHRFVEGWDTKIKTMYHQCQAMGSEKPIITTYLTAFDPFLPKETYDLTPHRMDFHKFLAEGSAFFIPMAIENHEKLTAPIPSRFYSAHFAFTDGKLCEEVPHDPDYYFYGEEISIAVRAFTHGYDLYHPHKVLCWHEYTRSARFKHWDDHDLNRRDIKKIKQSWWDRDVIAQKRNKVLFGIEPDDSVFIQEKYNFGKVRTLKDYEKYAGINFKNREILIHTLLGKLPPNAYNENYVSGADPRTLDIKTISKPVTISLKSNESNANVDINRIKFEVFDSKNRLIESYTFNSDVVSILKNSDAPLAFNLNFDVADDTDTFYYVTTIFDGMNRPIFSSKKSL